MKRWCYFFLLAALTVSACSQPVPPPKPSAQAVEAETMVASFYKKVIARPTFLFDDQKVFAPYLSKGVLQGFDDANACYEDWQRQNPGTTDKPPFGIEFKPFTAGIEYFPQTFHIERTELRKDGSFLVYVTFTYSDPTGKLVWHAAVTVVRENGRPVVGEIVFPEEGNGQPYEERLSKALKQTGCNGRRYVGWPG
jgi:hypothetical protein